MDVAGRRERPKIQRHLRRAFDGSSALLFITAAVILSVLGTEVDYLLVYLLGQGVFARVMILLLMILLLTAIGLVLWMRFEHVLDTRADAYLTPDRLAPRCRALIAFVSMTADSARAVETAIAHHLRPADADESLAVCWLIHTTESKAHADSLEANYRDRLTVIPVHLPCAEDSEMAYRRVLTIIDELGRVPVAPPLSEAELTLDITGGTKPMTASAVLACFERRIPMQYIHTIRDAAGKIVASSATAIAVRVATASGETASAPTTQEAQAVRLTAESRTAPDQPVG